MSQLLTVVLAFGALQSFLMAFVLAASGERARRLLAAFVASIGITIGGTVLFSSDVLQAAPHLAYLATPAHYLIAPLFYLFIEAMAGRTDRRVWPHLIVSAGVVVWLLPFYLSSASSKLLQLSSMQAGGNSRLALLLIQAFTYLGLTTWTLFRFDREQRQPMLWLATSSMAALWLAALARAAFSFPATVIPVALSAVTVSAAVVMMRQRSATPDPRPSRTSRTVLPEDRMDRIATRLAEALERDQLHLDPNLTLESLGSRVGIPGHTISHVVNSRFGKNFNDWVNAHRVEEAKRRLRDERYAHLSIVAVGESAGFGSKSAFNAAFRRLTAVTPSVYRRGSP